MALKETRLRRKPHSHQIILLLILLAVITVGILNNYCFVCAAGGITSAKFLLPVAGNKYQVNNSIPIDFEVRTNSRTTKAYVFVKLDSLPDTSPNSPDLIFSNSYMAGYYRIKTAFKPTQTGTYAIVVYITDAQSFEYYSEALKVEVVEGGSGINPGTGSSDSTTTENISAPSAGIGRNDIGGPGGAIADAGGEKGFFAFGVPAYTPIIIPFQRTSQHGVEKIEVVSSNRSTQNAIILDQHNHTNQTPPGHVYKYVELTHTHPWNHEEISFAITFQVNRSWMLDYVLNPANITMYHFVNNRWEPIETKIIELNYDFVRYVGTSDSIYPMAIVGNPTTRIGFETQLHPFG